MPTTQSTVVAVFRNRTDADNAANELKANGFNSNNIYVGSYSNAVGNETTPEWNATHHHEGGIAGWFKSLFGENDDASDYRAYENAAKRGQIVLTLQTAEQNITRAEEIIREHNPVDVSENASASTATAANARSATAAGANTAASTAARAKTTGSGSDLPASIPVVQEDLQVGKRSVLRGGVRIYSRVVETPVQEKVNLREERIRIDRQPVNRAARAGELRAGSEQVIEVQEYAEEPVVQKQARVVEEIRVSKDVSERTETVNDTVRRREVEVEDLGRGQTGQRATATSGTGATTATAGSDYRDDFRRDFQTRYATSGGRYEDYAPAYDYGYTAASDPRYQGRSWDQVESDLRSDYGRRYPNSTWERMKDSIRYGWDKVTGRTRAATSHGD